MPFLLSQQRSRSVAVWLFVLAAFILAMVVVGGATRLTGSGLSITEWRPVTGAIPPLDEAGWQSEFAKYKTIPQYHLLNRDMTLPEFKVIYGWEWGHRLLGRLVGLVFLAPFLTLLVLRKVPRRLFWRCGLLFGLGGLQGLVGWWMVSSGLSERVSVAPERLAIHLGLALALFVLVIWTALEAWYGEVRNASAGPWRPWTLVLLGGVFLQCLLGALVAGTHAGFIFNDWPLMNGEMWPKDYWAGSFWMTLAHNQASVQFHHRLGAYGLSVAAVAVAILAARPSSMLASQSRLAAYGLAAVILLQAVLGVITLMAVTPVWLGMLHQSGAVLLLLAATYLAWRVRRT
ncbi:MAG: COX15/CtaA family protein [Caulobacter sp.]|nr:COX15/CtaA family protein [Caulobacter sp.]